MFKYLFIPSDISQKIDERTASKDGGLENDALRRGAEDFFQESHESIDKDAEKRATADALLQQGVEPAKISEIMSSIGGGHMGSSVEIITVCVATEKNQFTGVSMYSDAHISFKPETPINKRASKLLRNCCHNIDVKGDVFIGRAFDDEREEWQRLDFLISDTEDDAPWIKSTQVANAGRNMDGYRTSGAMKKIMQPGANVLGGAEEKVAEVLEPLDTGYLSWSQTDDEVEVQFVLPNDCTAKLLTVSISSSTLKISPKSGEPLADVGIQYQSSEGATFFGKVLKDDSTWSISVENSIKVLSVTLAKADNLSWKHLLS